MIAIEMVTQNDFQLLNDKLDKLLHWFSEAKDKQEADKVYNSKQVCKRLNISSKTLQTYRDIGLIEFNQVGRKIFYTEDAIQRFLKGHAVKRK